MADRMIDKMAVRAPNFRDAIVDQVVLTHQYFEKTFGITDGDFCHGLLHPGQMWDRRPVPGWSDYRDLCSECVEFHATQKCAEACPVECCVPDPERRETEEALFERAQRIHAARGVALTRNSHS